MVLKCHRRLFQTLLMLLLVAASMNVSAGGGGGGAWDRIMLKIRSIVCQFKDVFATVATGVAALVMVIAAIQWISSEADPGTRKKAKTTMVHALVGLIIISIADDIAGLVLSVGCPT